MRKILSLLLAFLMILGVFSFPAITASNQIEDAGQFLKEIGIIKGNEKGDLMENSHLKREEAIAILIRMLGKEDEAFKQFKEQHEKIFDDVEDDNWAAAYVLYAKQQGLTKGLGDGNFGLGQKVNAKQFLSFMLRALNYSADWSKDDIMQISKNTGILDDLDLNDEDIITRNEVFKIMKKALHTNPKDKMQNLMEVIGIYNKENKYKEEKYKDHKEFKLLSVENLNYDKLILKFNQDIEEKDIEDLGITTRIMLLNQEKIILKVLDVDDATLKIQVNKNLELGKKYKLKAKELIAESGAVLTPVEMEFELDPKLTPNPTQNTADDDNQIAQKPFKVERIIANNLKDIKIVFNQNISQTSVQENIPVNSDVKSQFQFIGDDLGEIKITEIEDKYVILEIRKAFEVDTKYSIYVGGIQSETGEFLKGEIHKFQVVNLDAPVVSEIKPVGLNMLIIEFSEPILETGKVIIGKADQRLIEITGESIVMNGRKAVVTTPADFEDQVEYEIEVRGFFDYEKKANKKAKERFVFDLHSIYIKD